MGLVRRLRQALLYQRGNLFGWLPVGMATGIALYFGLKFEPGLALLASACCLVLGLMLLASKLDESLSPIPILFAMVALGFFWELGGRIQSQAQCWIGGITARLKGGSLAWTGAHRTPFA